MWAVVIGIYTVVQAVLGQDVCPNVCMCDNLIVDCKYVGIEYLPEEISQDVISLDLAYNNFIAIPANLKKLQNLKYLNMSHNKISTLKDSDFQGLEKLEQIDFSFNVFHDWKDIHSSVFQPTKNLMYLDFSNNPLRSIPRLSKHLDIKSLVILRLTNCLMRALHVNVFNGLVSLRELHLSDNPISSINDSFHLRQLKYLDLSQCHIDYIRDTAFSGLTSLETLNLKNNLFLRRVTINSDGLLYLDLSNCTIESVPEGKLFGLTLLNLSSNFLKEISDKQFYNYFSLQLLDLSRNAIMNIEDSAFSSMSQLKILDLSFNKLTRISQKLFESTVSLYKINISRNHVSTIDTIKSSSLKILDASYCEIYSIDRLSLEGMPNLASLNLSRNFISHLPDGIYSKSLVFLDLSSCRIKSINNRTFEEMFFLRYINLAGNLLTTVDPSFFPRVISVNLADNLWRCDCKKLKTTYEWLSTYNEDDLNQLVCDSPEQVQGKTWYQACSREWYPNILRKETLWWYSVGVMIVMVILLFGVMAARKIHSIRETRLREIEEERRAQEREALRRMQRLQREYTEEENRNAPDPREQQGPPSYNEALLMPRIDASNQSLQSIASRESMSDKTRQGARRKRRRRRKSDTDSRRSSRVVVNNSDSSDNERTTRRALESDF